MISFTCVVGIVFHGRRHLLHGRGGLFQRTGLLFGAGREVQVTTGDLIRGDCDSVGAGAYFSHNRQQVIVHALQRLHQDAGFIARGDLHLGTQIARGNAFSNVNRSNQRTHNRAGQEVAQHNRGQNRQRGENQRDGDGGLTIFHNTLTFAAQLRVLRVGKIYRILQEFILGGGHRFQDIGAGCIKIARFDQADQFSFDLLKCLRRGQQTSDLFLTDGCNLDVLNLFHRDVSALRGFIQLPITFHIHFRTVCVDHHAAQVFDLIVDAIAHIKCQSYFHIAIVNDR